MEDIFEDVPEDRYFHVSNGMIIKNLNDFCAILDLVDNGVFESHVNKEKNDFANWARHVYDDDLADILQKTKTKKSMLRKLKSYIQKGDECDVDVEFFGHKIEKFLAGLIVGCLFGISLGIFIFAFFF